MKPFIKYPGGKYQELKKIREILPAHIENYYEPFVGGGAVYLNIDANHYFINDKSEELINLYEDIKSQNCIFLKTLNEIIICWGLLQDIATKHTMYLLNAYMEYSKNKININQLQNIIINFVEDNEDEFNGMMHPSFVIDIQHLKQEFVKSLIRKMKRIPSLEQDSGKLEKQDLIKIIETGFKSAFYTHFRYLYNKRTKMNLDKHFSNAIFYFIREYCYSSMFRYNENNEFNVPYGGMSYNKKTLLPKLENIQSSELIEKLNNTEISCMDFQEFMSNKILNQNDFIFLDPPYDTQFSDYANNDFTLNDQIRLAEFCYQLNCNFMLVIKRTDFIFDLYNRFNIYEFNKNYSVSFQNRNDKNVDHLIITNY